jgi:hypothetical protein
MSDPATVAAPAAAPAPASVPTVSQPVTVDWGDWVAQALANETPIIEAAASGGVSLALAQIPFGSFVSTFIGPTIVDQYVLQGLTALEGVLKSEKLSVPASATLETTVANMLNANEPALAKFLGSELGPTISAAVGKLGL